MAEQKKDEKKDKAPVLIAEIGKEKGDMKAYIEDAADALGVKPGSQEALKLAVYRYIADTLKASGALRQQGWQQFLATPGWFGTNSSAGAQALGYRSELEKIKKEVEA